MNTTEKYAYDYLKDKFPYSNEVRMVSLNLQLYERYKDFHLLNDKDMAERLGFSRAYMSRIVGGSRAPSSFFIETYLKVTGLSFERAFKCNGDHSIQKDNWKKEKGEMDYVEWSERGSKK